MLQDAVLRIGQTRVVGVEDLASGRYVEVVDGARVPRQLEHQVQPGADHSRLGTLLAGALEPIHLTLRRGADRLGQVSGVQSRAIPVGDALVAVAELAADGGHLLAQDMLALGLGQVVGDVGLDVATDLQLRQQLAGPTHHQLQARLDVEGLQDLHPLGEIEVGDECGGVGQRAGIGDATQRFGDAAAAAQLQHRLDGRAVLAGEFPGARRGGRL